MLKAFARFVTAGALMLPLVAQAEPIKLKLAFFSSDRSNVYQTSVKPFVDSVNRDGRGIVEIDVSFSGTITKVQTQQPQLVADGTVDIAIIVPGLSPDRFYDNTVIELPGLFRDPHEASYVFTRLIETGALKGYEDFFVIGAFVSDGEIIHSRKPIASVADLAGLKIRANNRSEAAALGQLGAIPVLLAINQTTDAITQGNIDGATLPPAMLYEFGLGRITSHHYLLQLGGAPTALVMNRAKFESLPPPAQAIIRKYSGEWLAERSAAGFDVLNSQVLAQLKSDRRRQVVGLSSSDADAAQRAFNDVIGEWASSSRHNRELLAQARAEIAKFRSAKVVQ